MVSEREKTAEKLSVEEQKFKEISKQYEKLKTLLDQKTQSRTRRLNTSTTMDTISNPNSGLSMVVRMEHCLVHGTLCQEKPQWL